jgi:hypothetical protein
MNYEAGDTIRFTYNNSESQDKFKYVLVVAPMYEGKVHALDLKIITDAQREVLREVFNPNTKRPHPIALVNDIFSRMPNPQEDVKHPITFYSRFVRPFLNVAGDIYRTYFPEKMLNVQVVESGSPYQRTSPTLFQPTLTTVKPGPVIKPGTGKPPGPGPRKPLFKKI